MTTTSESTEFLQRLKAFEGRQIGPPELAPDVVNQAMIRHWCQAIGDTNPVYTDPEAAAASVHGGIVAPPTMLQAWVMRGFRGGRGRTSQDELLGLLEGAGFTSVVATDCRQEYPRYLRPGDRLSETKVIESISEEKKTALGTGHFVTTLSTYTDQSGAVVGTMRFRILKFRPAARKAAAGERPRRPRPAVTRDNAWWFDACKQHRLLIQRCVSCGTLRHPPEPMCGTCRSPDWDTVEASGRGIVYSFVVNHYPQVAAFDYPLAVGLIELEEGTRLVANLVAIDPGDIRVELPVEVEFVDHDEDLTLPAFHPIAPAGS
jgi:uncharacterized OB-fold protein/acyl dehydratase